jgi:hypothetical protein
VIYDLREHRVQVNGGAWTDVASLGSTLRAEWLALVQYWERLRLAGVPGEQDES